MTDLVERVAEAMYRGFDEGDVSGTPASWEETAAWPSERRPWYAAARAAIAAVRAADVQRGPSRDEITAACLVYGGSSFAGRMSKSLNAAAKVRAEEVEG